jgi:hypothetical protein
MSGQILLFSRSEREVKRKKSLSGGVFMSGKEQLNQEIPIPPEIEKWINTADMQYDTSELEDQQELDESNESEMDVVTDKTPPVENLNQIIGYNEAQDQYVLKSAGEISYVDSSELFQQVSNGEKIFVEGVKDFIPGFSITFQDNEDRFIKEDNAMYVQHITIDEFKKKLDSIYRQLNHRVSSIQYMTISKTLF